MGLESVGGEGVFVIQTVECEVWRGKLSLIFIR